MVPQTVAMIERIGTAEASLAQTADRIKAEAR